MRTSRRGLLATAAAGLVVAAPAAAWGPVDAAIAAKAKRCKCVPAGEFELLARKVEDLKAQVRGLSARLTNAGFAPACITQSYTHAGGVLGTVYTTAKCTMPFAGSVIALGVDFSAAPVGAGSDYVEVRLDKNAAVTAATMQVLQGVTGKTYGPVEKGTISFVAGDELSVDVEFVSALLAAGSFQILIWVSFN